MLKTISCYMVPRYIKILHYFRLQFAMTSWYENASCITGFVACDKIQHCVLVLVSLSLGLPNYWIDRGVTHVTHECLNALSLRLGRRIDKSISFRTDITFSLIAPSTFSSRKKQMAVFETCKCIIYRDIKKFTTTMNINIQKIEFTLYANRQYCYSKRILITIIGY